MGILHEVDKPGSDVEEYIYSLDQILTNHMDMIKGLKNKLSTFKGHLSQEAVLSKKFYEEQERHGLLEDDVEMIDCFDMCEEDDEGIIGPC